MNVRQSFFLSGILATALRLAAAESFAIEKARQEVERLKELAAIGAVSQARLEQAREKLADARDEETLHRLVYGNIGVESLSEQQAREIIDAASRRVERTARLYQVQAALVDQGVLPRAQLQDLEQQLADRRLGLQLAENRARTFTELLNMVRVEEQFLASPEADIEPPPLVEKFGGSGVFKPEHLRFVEAAFEKQFGHPLPVSARGQSALHTSLGFDHAGRVDVGVNPDDPEGQWLRQQLQSLRVPYIALRAMIPGQSTAPHIHIGPPSLRLRSADQQLSGGLN
ncbi:MAG: hypothetical protein ACK5TN_18700 [Acidobacteriota bacterium]